MLAKRDACGSNYLDPTAELSQEHARPQMLF